MKMTYKKPYYLASAALAMCLAAGVSGQTVTNNYNWSGLGDGISWSDPANWLQGVVPPNNPSGSTISGDIFVDPPTAGPATTVIGASDVVNNIGTLQGPEWGQTLDIYGTVNDGYAVSVVATTGGAVTSTLNLYGNGSITTGDSIFIGDPWWAAGIANSTINLYDNSQMTAPWISVAGHLNIYGGTVTATSGFLTGTATTGSWGSTNTTDATRLIDVAGGQLVITGDASAQASDLISRGILEGDGVVGNVNVDTTSMSGWTIITAVPEPTSMALLGLSGLALILRRRLVS